MKRTITKEEWSKLRKGSILKSPSGALRIIIEPKKRNSIYATFEKVVQSGYNNPTTTYVYNDLCNGYTVVKY